MRRLPSVTALVVVMSARAASADEPPALDLPEPTMPPRVEIIERTASPTYYRLPPQTSHFLSRSAVGAHTRLTGETDTAFSLDLLMGAALRFHRGSNIALWLEGGYGYVKGREHLAVLGAGVAYRKRGLASKLLALVPHVVAGSIDGTACVGVRTSVIAGFSMYALELAHQVARLDGKQVHELHAAVTFPFVWGLE